MYMAFNAGGRYTGVRLMNAVYKAAEAEGIPGVGHEDGDKEFLHWLDDYMEGDYTEEDE